MASINPIHQVEHTLQDLRSPKRAHTFWGLIITLIVCGGLLWLKHGEWLDRPNDILLSAGGDTPKNYFTTAWHLKRDSGYVLYRGMNYPWGEHVLFTDNQPIFSAALQWWSRHVSDLSDDAAGAVNIFQVVSLLLGCGAVFLLLRKLHLPVWYAGLAAVGMTFLAPQYSRFDGHFGLSHTFVIPMMLYLLCLYEERGSRRYQSLQIGFLMWFSAQLHFYYFGMGALFLSLYIGFQMLRQPNLENILRRLSHWIVMVLLPFVLLNLWVHWAHYSPDRPNSPYGFTVYIGFWEGVFLPYEGMPMFEFIDKNIIHIRRISFEAWAYAGAIALPLTLWFLFSRYKMFGKTWDEAASHRVRKQFLRGMVFAGSFLLLYSLGFPFAIKGMEWLVDYMGPLKQFRGLGRFSWVYFYVVNTIALYGAWNWGRRFTGFKGGKAVWFKWVIILTPVALLLLEAWYWQRIKHLHPQPNPMIRENFAADPNHWLNKVDFKGYQAILPLPYYHLGSENIWREGDGNHFMRVQATCYHTGLPDMGVMMSRSSLGETLQSIQLVMEPLETPSILTQLPDERPIALMVDNSKWHDVSRKYWHLIAAAQLVYESEQVKIYALNLDSLRARIKTNVSDISTRLNRGDLHPMDDGCLSTQPVKNYVYETFDDKTDAKYKFQGKGALSGPRSDTVWIWRGPLPQGEYMFTCWMRVAQDMGMAAEIKLVETGIKDGVEIHLQHEGTHHYLKSVVGEWGLFEFRCASLQGQNMNIFLVPSPINSQAYIDEIMIKPINTEVFCKKPGWIIQNNFWYRSDF